MTTNEKKKNEQNELKKINGYVVCDQRKIISYEG